MISWLTRFVIVGVVFAAATLAAQSADARATKRKCNPSTAGALVHNVPLVDQSAVMALQVNKNVVTTIAMRGKITQLIIPKQQVKRFWVQQTGKKHEILEFKPTTAPATTITSFTIKSKHETVYLLIRVVDDVKATGCLLYRVVSQPPELVWKKRLQPWADKQVSEQHERDVAIFEAERSKERKAHESEREREQEEFYRRFQELEAKARRDVRIGVARHILRRKDSKDAVMYPRTERIGENGSPLGARLSAAHWSGTEFLIPFELNVQKGHRALDFIGARVSNREGKEIPSELLYVEQRNESNESPSGAVAVVERSGSVNGVLSLPEATKHSIDNMRIEFLVRGMQPGVVAVGRWYTSNAAELDREMRAKQASLSMRLLGGAFWTGDAVDGTDAIAGTSMGGVAVRYQKGYLNGFALEIEGAGARTDQARFRDANWNGMQGEIARSASLFRFMAGGAARLGDRYVTTVRLGIGIQATSYNSSFTTGSTTMEGPGAQFEIDGVWSFGASFDARLGKSWVLGLGATLSDGINTDARGLDAALHLGYRWNP